MAAADIDVAYICASYAVSEPDVKSLLDAPTTELVHSFLLQLDAKAREHDELRSEKFRQDVELENSIRNGESRAEALKSNLEKAQKEVETLRKQLNDTGMAPRSPNLRQHQY
jgi:nucleoprotein TPR